MSLVKKLTKSAAIGVSAGMISLFPYMNNAAGQEVRNGEYNAKACYNSIIGNSLLQGVIGGIGGWQEGYSFWNNFTKGMVGGALIASGKCMVTRNINNAWPAKIVGSVGSSIVYNASNGDEMFHSLGFDYGPLFIDWEKDRGIEGYILPESLAVLMYEFNNSFLEADLSLKYGAVIFSTEHYQTDISGRDIGGDTGENIDAMTKTNIIVIKRDSMEDLRHELVHNHQYSSYRALGNVILKSNRNSRDFREEIENYHLNIDFAVGNLPVYIFEIHDEKDGPEENEAENLSGRN